MCPKDLELEFSPNGSAPGRRRAANQRRHPAEPTNQSGASNTRPFPAPNVGDAGMRIGREDDLTEGRHKVQNPPAFPSRVLPLFHRGEQVREGTRAGQTWACQSERAGASPSYAHTPALPLPPTTPTPARPSNRCLPLPRKQQSARSHLMAFLSTHTSTCPSRRCHSFSLAPPAGSTHLLHMRDALPPFPPPLPCL